ncbi:hypothetical protein EUX98_g5208 [Antrodiella citrinella]|uniref:Uncharacterized protein n=1 Tax=Antrodiella citrinella TaxID=2447956 RepID=A0A4S4MS18_9APHY|nr:hypothetical protein EUX98_g5208 [Antrodiella citrinella]
MQPVDHEQPSSSLKSASFFTALSNTCRIILAQDIIPDPRSSSSSATTSPSPAPSNTADDAAPEVNVGEIPRAAVTKVNHRLTGHTVQTMLWGATRGWTTLTANKTSVKAILREMKTSGNAVWERTTGHVDSGGETEVAALWVVEPRSLAEGMRADFQAT